MRRLVLTLTFTVGLLSAALLWQPASGQAGGLDAKIKAALDKIGASIAKGNGNEARKEAEALAKKLEELNEVMYGFKLRTKGGLGVGNKPNVVVPDGIELKLNALARDGITVAQAAKESDALVESAWWTAAIAEVAIVKAPPKDLAKKPKAKWIEWSEGTREAAKLLAAAAKAKNIPAIKEAAIKVTNNCNSCHTLFRD